MESTLKKVSTLDAERNGERRGQQPAKEELHSLKPPSTNESEQKLSKAVRGIPDAHGEGFAGQEKSARNSVFDDDSDDDDIESEAENRHDNSADSDLSESDLL